MKLLLGFLFCQIGVILCFECPSLPDNFKLVKSHRKCYAARILDEADRSYEKANDICQNELSNGHLADIQNEDVFYLKTLIENFLFKYPAFNHGVMIDGKLMPAFFVGFNATLENGVIRYYWPRGHMIYDEQILGSERTDFLYLVVNDIILRASLYSGHQESDIGTALCEVYSILDCPVAPNGWLSFRTNVNCVLIRPLEPEERTWTKASEICESMPGMRMTQLFGDPLLLSFLGEIVTRCLETFTEKIADDELPSFYFYDSRNYVGLDINKVGLAVSNVSVGLTAGAHYTNGIMCSLEPDLSTGDPHLLHYIRRAGKYICHDLTGEPQQKFILYKDLLTNIIIAGQLRDDYYFGNIIISSSSFNFTIGANQLWKAKEVINFGEKLKIEIWSETEILIIVNNGQSGRFIIKKSENNFGLSYLNFQIVQMNEERSGGIFGDISKNKYEFFGNVQENSMSAIVVGKKTFNARVTKRENCYCWLISTEAALYPKTKREYILD